MKSSKWSWASARSWKESSTSSRGWGESTRSSVKAGTQRRVTAEIAPRAPTPTRAARSRSPSASSSRTLPSARTSSIAATWEEMLRSLAPVPWVPVEIEPAIVWRSMSPRFSIASPSSCSRSLSSARIVPPPTLTSPDAGSASITPLSAPTSIIVPSVIAASVKEWPEPATLIGRPSAAADADRARQLVAVARADQLPRVADLVSRPVAPLGHRPSLDSADLQPGGAAAAAGDARAAPCAARRRR